MWMVVVMEITFGAAAVAPFDVGCDLAAVAIAAHIGACDLLHCWDSLSAELARDLAL